MSLHTDWDDAMDDIFRLGSIPATLFNVFESIEQKHSNMKITVRCLACAGLVGLTYRHFQKHHFQKGQKPSLSATCPHPHCEKPINQHNVDYVSVQNA